MFRKLKRAISHLIFYIVPRIYNLPQCVYIRWMDNEYIIPKNNNGNW